MLYEDSYGNQLTEEEWEEYQDTDVDRYGIYSEFYDEVKSRHYEYLDQYRSDTDPNY